MADRTYAISEIVGTSPQDVNQAIRNGIKMTAMPAWRVPWRACA